MNSRAMPRRYEVRDASGLPVAVHVRVEKPDGTKRFSWERPDGRPGLGGMAVADLPLYGIERLDGLAFGIVVLVEGEKAAEALWNVGIAAVASVTGAATAPGPGPLADLGGRDVVLWPDADDVGRRHMAVIAERLAGVAASAAIVEPPDDVPSGWDAADAVAQGRDVGAICADATPLTQRHDPARLGGSLPKARAPEFRITLLSAVKSLPLEWLWDGYIPAGMVTMLDGDPGLGKSLLALDLAARVTRGQPMPGDPEASLKEPRGVVVLSAEDDRARTIRPRLEAAGADLDRAAVVDLCEADGTTRDPAITPSDLAAVEAAIRKVEAALLVVDPLVAYLPDAINANRDHDVRRALTLLKDLGEHTGCTVIAIRHLRKSPSDNAMYRGGGSIGIIGAARAAYLMAPDPDEPGGNRRILAPTKQNVGPLPNSVAFRVVVDGLGSLPRLAWEGPSHHTAASLSALTAKDAKDSERERAADLLAELLADGPMPATEVQRHAAEAGISERTLDRAKAVLRIRSRPTGRPGQPGVWVWDLAKDANTGRRMPTFQPGTLRERLAPFEGRAVEEDFPRSAWEAGSEPQ